MKDDVITQIREMIRNYILNEKTGYVITLRFDKIKQLIHGKYKMRWTVFEDEMKLMTLDDLLILRRDIDDTINGAPAE